MSEQPLTAGPKVPTPAPKSPPPRQLTLAGALLMASGGVVACFGLLLMSVGQVEPMFLFALFPWLYVFISTPFAAAATLLLGVGLLFLGVAVSRGSRDALVGALILLSVEGLPSVFVAVLSGGGSFAILALPRLALVLYLASLLRPVDSALPTSPQASARTTEVPGTSPAPVRRTASSVSAWIVAAVLGLAMGLANRAAYNLIVLDISNTYERFYTLLDWWFQRSWPGGILAFTIGWFATSRKVAVGRAVVALLAAALIPLSDLGDNGTFELMGAAFLGGIMGWLGFVGRGHRWTAIMAALAAPALMAFDAAAHRPSDPPLSLGRWAMLAAAGALALLIIVRGATIAKKRSAERPETI